MRVTGLAGDLAAWRELRDAGGIDDDLSDLLQRLRDWKTQHDADRAWQAGPFLTMVWDGVFADDAHAVTQAIGEIEQALARR